MESRFNKYVSSVNSTSPLLPLTHTTDMFSFRGILEDRVIKTAECKRFHEALIYFFYGRPAYRPSTWDGDIDYTNPAFFPCCIIVRSEESINLKRIAPFDTGGWNLYSHHLHPHMKTESFFLDLNMKRPSQVVEKFFGTNSNYYSCKPIPVVIPPFEFEALSYYQIIRDRNVSNDDRGSAIEIQCGESLILTRANVLYAIFPTVFLDQSLIQETIIKEWGFMPGHYEIYAGLREQMGMIYLLINEFLRVKGYL